MGVWSHAVPGQTLLSGRQGALIQVRVSTDPRLLEDLLECLAGVSFPINPEITHGRPTIVAFPAYEGRVYEVQDALRVFGFSPASMTFCGMLEAIS